MTYLSLNDHLRRRFGTKVYKLSLSSGCTCPNRDGTLGTEGCLFCSAGGSGDFASPFAPLEEQLAAAKLRVDKKFPHIIEESERKYIAYFQSYSNTYGPVERLRALFGAALARPEIVALSIATRPDCLAEAMVEMLAELNAQKPVWVELGLQTVHEQVAQRMGRGYRLPVFLDAYDRLKAAGLEVVVHLIVGLPGESREDTLDSVRFVARLNPMLDGIKLQLLHVLDGTALGRAYLREPFPVLSLEEYCDTIVACLKLLPPQTVVHRLTGDGPKRLLLAPLWSADKKRVLNALKMAIAQADSEKR